VKRLPLILLLVAAPLSALTQGTVTFANFSGQEAQTNSLARGGSRGNTAPIGGAFYFELLTAPSTVTTVDASLQGLLQLFGSWSDTGIRATNTSFAAGGRAFAGTACTVTNWPAGTLQSFIVVGWSANEGTNWTDVSAKLSGAFLSPANGGAYWSGGFTPLVNGGFIGASAVQSAIAGGGSDQIPPFPIFGTTPSSQGTPISAPIQLYVVGASPPYLNITNSGGNIIARWPTAAGSGFILEASLDLGNPAAWTPLSTNGPIVNSNYQVTVPPTNVARLFRLRQ
jgi:hypothetical protein